MIPKENVVVMVTHEGYVKKMSAKAYAARKEETTLKPGDYMTHLFDVTTQDNLLFFTNLGNYIFMPVHKIPEAKWKDLGKHINNVVSLSPEEKVVSAMIYQSDGEVISVTKMGMIKRTKMKDFEVSRTSKAIGAMKLKENDEVVTSILADKNVFLLIIGVISSAVLCFAVGCLIDSIRNFMFKKFKIKYRIYNVLNMMLNK